MPARLPLNNVDRSTWYEKNNLENDHVCITPYDKQTTKPASSNDNKQLYNPCCHIFCTLRSSATRITTQEQRKRERKKEDKNDNILHKTIHKINSNQKCLTLESDETSLNCPFL